MGLHVFCEALLAACCTVATVSALRSRAELAALGFALIGSAAMLGALVYAGIEATTAAHAGASLLAARLGLLLIATQAVRERLWGTAVVLLGVLSLLVPAPLDQGIAVLALVAIAWKGRSRQWPLAVAGAVLFALAGLVIGTRGEWLGLPRVDLFHLGLAAAVLAWWRAGIAQRPWRDEQARRIAEPVT